MLLLAFLTFFVGSWKPGYVASPPQGSYLIDFFKTLWGAMCMKNNGKPSDGKPIQCLHRLKGLPGMPSDRLIDEFRMVLITSSIFLPFSIFWFTNSQMYSWGYNQCVSSLSLLSPSLSFSLLPCLRSDLTGSDPFPLNRIPP